MKLRHLHFVISPWTNAAIAIVWGVCIRFAIWPFTQSRAIIIVGALIGLLAAVLDAASRPAIQSALRAASSFREVMLALSSTSLAKARQYIGILALIAAWFVLNAKLPNTDVAPWLLCGFALVHFVSHAVLGFWTAWPDTANKGAL